MNRKGQNPGDRIGNIQTEQSMLDMEKGEDPQDAEGTGPGQRDQHRHDGIAQTADASAADVHQTAEKIGSTDNRKPD